MKCPSCATESPDGGAECAQCGVNFAKWQAKAVRQAVEAEVAAEQAILTPPSRPAAPGSTLKMTLGAMGALCALIFGAYSVVHRRMEPPTARSGALVALDGFRPRITGIEAALYRAGPATVADAKFISGESTSLAGAVMARDQENPFVRDAVGDLLEFSGVVASAEEGAAMLPTARLDWARRWEVIRSRRFEKAPWLHAAITPDDAPPPDFERAVARMQTVGHRLKTLMAEVPAQLADFDKDGVTFKDVKRLGAPAREKLEDWRAWRTRWQAEVDQALLGFPKPEEIPQELQKPYDGFVKTAQDARNPPNPGPDAAVTGPDASAFYLPGKESRDAWVTDVEKSLSDVDDGISAARQAKTEADKS